MTSKRRVVVTGMGAITGLGLDADALWRAMLEGTCGISPITTFDITDYKSPNAGQVDSEALSAAMQTYRIRKIERSVDFAMLVSAQALEQAGLLSLDDPQPQTIATIFGTGGGSSHGLLKTYMAFAEKGLRGLRPTTVPKLMANAISSQISVRYRLKGPNYVIVSACSSSTTAIGTGFRMIRDGYTDRVLCGGTDALLDPASYGGWNNLGVMSTIPDPATCCRPFDVKRDGCVLGEGAGALLLEPRDLARERGATILGEISGFGESSDALHLTAPNAEGQTRAIIAALADAEVSAEQIGFINAHGTGTHANDSCESQSIRQAFGAHADTIPVASNKSFFGHLLGACGVVETIVALRGLAEGQMPGNLNLDNPDPECNLCFSGREPCPMTSELVLKNSFGFGGNNAVLVLKRHNA